MDVRNLIFRVWALEAHIHFAETLPILGKSLEPNRIGLTSWRSVHLSLGFIGMGPGDLPNGIH